MDSLENEYYNAIKRWENTHKATWSSNNEQNAKVLDEIIGRGFWLCLNNPVEGILLSSVNPSYPSNSKAEKAVCCSFNQCLGRYWNRWNQNLQYFKSKNIAGYLDLFPLRVSKQKEEFEKYVPLELKAELLRVTQTEIERLKPQLIIHANKASSFYYGTDPEHPWMGYDLEPLNNTTELREKGCELYRINGLLNTKDRVNYDLIKETKLVGTYLFTCPMQNYRFLKAEKKLEEQDIINLCNELNIII